MLRSHERCRKHDSNMTSTPTVNQNKASEGTAMQSQGTSGGGKTGGSKRVSAKEMRERRTYKGKRGSVHLRQAAFLSLWMRGIGKAMSHQADFRSDSLAQ